MQRGRVRVLPINLSQFSRTRYGLNSFKEAGLSRVCVCVFLFFSFFLFVFFVWCGGCCSQHKKLGNSCRGVGLWCIP